MSAMRAAAQPLLEVSALGGGYGEIQVLWDVSLRVDPNEIVTIVGANGAGKSTTLRTIVGLLPARGGMMTFGGVPLRKRAAHDIVALGLTMVPEGRDLFPFMTVLENLQAGSLPSHARKRRNESLERVYALFPMLAERPGQLAATLSGGQQQMVAIGRGLMSCPKLLMLDEPSLGIAPIVVDEIFRALRVIRDEGVAILLVEQNVQRALRLADRAYVIENGRTVVSDTASALLDSPDLKKRYLGL